MQKGAPTISVIVPVYNGERDLEQCVNSILAQSFTDFELLLIDDGSTDGTATICDRYASLDSRVRSFHKPNGGVSSARNLGITNANGKWIAYCDSDDYVTPSWLANYQVDDAGDADLIQQGARSDHPVWSCEKSNVCGFDFDGDPIEYLSNLDKQEMAGYPFIQLYRNDIVRRNNVLFDTRIHFREDMVYLLNYLSYCKRVISYNKQGYFYFAPNWVNKYSLSADQEIYLEKCLADFYDNLFASNFTSEIVRHHKDSYINHLICAFAKKPNLEFLKEIRRLHLKDYHCSRLTPQLKWLIVKDKSMFMSWFALLIHSNLRKLLRS